MHPAIIRMGQNSLLINFKKAKGSLVITSSASSGLPPRMSSLPPCVLLLLPPRLVALPDSSTVEVSSYYFPSSCSVISDVV